MLVNMGLRIVKCGIYRVVLFMTMHNYSHITRTKVTCLAPGNQLSKNPCVGPTSRQTVEGCMLARYAR
ncbi:hypothetical protein S83_058627 [Arachis hypogaea]